ncbi:unnamed protein product, partial [Prorocentrum cordatum]
MWAMEWTERDMASGNPNPFMVSKTSPTVDSLAEMTPVWPPAPGAKVSGTDRSCPFGIALAHYDAKKHGPFHDSDATVRRPIPGQPYYRVDRTTKMARFNKVDAAIREFFSARCERAAMWGTALPPIVWALVFRHEDRDNKTSALSVPAQCVAADRLLAASATLERMIDDPDQPGASGRAVEPPLTLQQADESPGCVFQRLLPAPREDHLNRTCDQHRTNEAQRRCVLATQNSLLTLCHGPPRTGKTKVAACIAAAYMSRLASGWGVGCFGGTNGSMDTLAEQIGKNLTEKVKGNTARKMTPVAKYAAEYNIPE